MWKDAKINKKRELYMDIIQLFLMDFVSIPIFSYTNLNCHRLCSFSCFCIMILWVFSYNTVWNQIYETQLNSKVQCIYFCVNWILCECVFFSLIYSVLRMNMIKSCDQSISFWFAFANGFVCIKYKQRKFITRQWHFHWYEKRK